jgi:hypothetical protein
MSAVNFAESPDHFLVPVDDMTVAQPFIPAKSVSSLVMSSQPPHPHAAALLVDFMISRKGQEIAFKQRRWPAFKDLAGGRPGRCRQPQYVGARC